MFDKIQAASAILALALLVPGQGAQAADSEILFEGQWTRKGSAVAGSWSIVEEGGKRFVVLDNAFKTKRAPDLKIFLSPLALSEVDGSNATDGSFLIAPLESHRGGQRYAIESNVALSEYASIVIQCEKYSKLWGAAHLAGNGRAISKRYSKAQLRNAIVSMDSAWHPKRAQ